MTYSYWPKNGMHFCSHVNVEMYAFSNGNQMYPKLSNRGEFSFTLTDKVAALKQHGNGQC